MNQSMRIYQQSITVVQNDKEEDIYRCCFLFERGETSMLQKKNKKTKRNDYFFSILLMELFIEPYGGRNDPSCVVVPIKLL